MAQISAESWPVRAGGAVLTSPHLSRKYRLWACAQCAVWSRAVLLAERWWRESGTFSPNGDGAVGPLASQGRLRVAAGRLVSGAERRNGRSRRRGAPQTRGRFPILRPRDRHYAAKQMDDGAPRLRRAARRPAQVLGTRE